MRRSSTVALAGLALLTGACAPSTATNEAENIGPNEREASEETIAPRVDETSNEEIAQSGSRGRVVTAEDISKSGARNAWEALSLLGGYVRLAEDKDRAPSRITSRGRASINLSSEPQIVLDGVRLVEYQLLRNVPAHHIDRIELLTGPQASIRYGTNSGNGVIVITTRTSMD